MANLTKPENGDWTLDAELLVVTKAGVVEIGKESEIRVLATDAEGRRWDFTFGTDATEQRLEDLVGQTISEVVALAAGQLRMKFSGGTALCVSPLAEVEAWEIRCDGDPVLIGAPIGGGVIVF